MNMQVKPAGSDTKARFNYLVCLDIVVVACILVIAGRPDGLAITLTAIIVAICAVLYRCSVSLGSFVTSRPPTPAPPPQDVDRKFKPATYEAPEQAPSGGGAKKSSWLRESD
ncbi:hypothetical protein ASC93_06425 [Massilia sp. Root335]|jgi:hypothetical protein|nr:hypothetical protein ASC93_06425 [Massilia sp. Root335]